MNLLKMFRPVAAQEIMEHQLFEAERLTVEHEAAAEHHGSLAEMYEQRVRRLRVSLGHDCAPAQVPWPDTEDFGTVVKSFK